MVDSADFERFNESKVELDALLSIEDLGKVPFLVLGNKIDAPGAVSEEELRHHLGLFQTTGKVCRSLSLHNSSSSWGFFFRVFPGQSASQRHSSYRNFHVLSGAETGLWRR